MKIQKIIISGMLVCSTAFAGDTNFVATVNSMWQTRNASNIVAYVDSYLATNRNAEALFARGAIALCLESWGRGAGDYLTQAVGEINSNSYYTVEQKGLLSKKITAYSGLFVAIANDANEPTNSVPTWNTNNQAIIFREIGDEFPYLFILEDIANTQ